MTTKVPPDKILLIMHKHGSMKREELRRRTRLKLHEMVLILECRRMKAGPE